MKVDSNSRPKSRWTGRFPISLGFFGLFLLVGVLGYWAVMARISGAIIASGMIQVENNRQIVQHQDGGVVGAILAKDGDQVSAGNIVLRLDDTFLKSELAIVESQLFESTARWARLEAERDELLEFTMPDSLLEFRDNQAEVQSLFDGQFRLFMARRDTNAAEMEQLGEQREQLNDQITGTRAELEALVIQLELIEEERTDSETLLEKGLIKASRVLGLRREEAKMKGMVGRLNANIAQLKGQISSLKLQELGLSTNRREEAISALRDIQFRQSELAQRRLILKERLSRLDVRTPVSGTVFGSTVFALKSVVQPAAPLMFIVPQDQLLIVSARIESIHIDQVHVGQEATLRFAAFDQRWTPEVLGIVSKLSADVILDEVTGISFYHAELIPNQDDMGKLRGQTLLPGMPVDAFIKTGDRSPLNYLAKPLTDYFSKAFREN